MSFQRTIQSLSMQDREGLPVIGMIMTVQFSVSGFSSRWNHCNQLANFFARFACANASDPERQSTLLSTFFNEVLEVLYRHQAGDGKIKLTFQKQNRHLSLRAEVPVDSQSRKFYRRAVEIASQPDLDAWYRNWLERSAKDDREDSDTTALAAGLLELVAVYESKLTIEDSSDSELPLLLHFEFPYEGEGVE